MAELAVANTILAQMGGSGRLAGMLGAKDFVGGERTLTFKWTAKALNKAYAVTVTLLPNDLYKVEFFKRGKAKWDLPATVGLYENVYAEDLVKVFEKEIGLRVNL